MKTDWDQRAREELGRIASFCEEWKDDPERVARYLRGVLEGYVKTNADLNIQIKDYIERLAGFVDARYLAAPVGTRFVGTATMTIDGQQHEACVYIGPSPIVIR